MGGKRKLHEWDGYARVYVGRVRAASEQGALVAIGKRVANQLKWEAKHGEWQTGAVVHMSADRVDENAE